ncbi:MAG: zinc-dependent metalloprotease, partial [Candidatus Aminicenantales bacterium]
LCFSLSLSVFPRVLDIAQKTRGMRENPGFIPFYWEESTGKIWLEISRFDEEFLYVSSLPAGVGSNDIGLDGRQLGTTRIVSFHRVGPRVLLVQSNTSFRALTDSVPEKRAVEEAFARSVLWGFRVEAEEEGRVLVDATDFFLRDAHGVIPRLQRAGQGRFTLDPSRSVIYLPRTKNFPRNTEIEALLTLSGKEPGRFLRQVAPDPGSLTVREHHSLVALPEPGFEPREYDPRSNFFGLSFMDFAAPLDQPLVQRFICRHRLKKKNPAADISEPVKPIVYYVDPGIPEPVRSAVIEGASWWNEAFEAIGYRNAFEVRVLPEDADPMDIRYNMINWVHRATRGWSYGSTVIDPRTGEIIKGHVALGSQRLRQDFLIAQGLVGDYGEDGTGSQAMVEMALARIRQLACHEVGHTLGLGHNYAASVNGRASVMDYPHPLVKIREDGSLDLSEAYTEGVGEWDKVSIAYGYQDFPDTVEETKELKAILDRAFSRGLFFLASQDAGPGSAHPYANTWDNGRDPVSELERVMRVRKIALARFSEKRIPPGTPMALLEDVLVPVYLFHRYQVEAAASVLGGLFYSHKLRGDVQELPKIVPGRDQRRALDAILRTLEPGNLVIPEKVLNMIPPRPPGYRETRELFPSHTGSPFDPLGAVEAAANLTLRLLLHPERAARLVEHHSRDSRYPGLGEVLDRLLDVTWKAEERSPRLGEIQRVVNSVVLYHMMSLVARSENASGVRAVAFSRIRQLREWIRDRLDAESAISDSQRAHFLFALSEIERFEKNPDRVSLPEPASPPPGAPIGMFGE